MVHLKRPSVKLRSFHVWFSTRALHILKLEGFISAHQVNNFLFAKLHKIASKVVPSPCHFYYTIFSKSVKWAATIVSILNNHSLLLLLSKSNIRLYNQRKSCWCKWNVLNLCFHSFFLRLVSSKTFSNLAIFSKYFIRKIKCFRLKWFGKSWNISVKWLFPPSCRPFLISLN
jgi:hypothetical protein